MSNKHTVEHQIEVGAFFVYVLPAVCCMCVFHVIAIQVLNIMLVYFKNVICVMRPIMCYINWNIAKEM